MKLKRTLFSIAVMTVLVGVFVVLGEKRGVAHDPTLPPDTNLQISIDNFSFAPAELTVKTGATVTWTNKDDVPHNIVSVDKLFASSVLDTDEKFSYTFRKTGTYTYYCSIHPRMIAKIVVK